MTASENENGRPEMTTHKSGRYVVHADSRWANGNSPVGIALAVRSFERGAPTPSHMIHAETACCEHCPKEI